MSDDTEHGTERGKWQVYEDVESIEYIGDIKHDI